MFRSLHFLFQGAAIGDGCWGNDVGTCAFSEGLFKYQLLPSFNHNRPFDHLPLCTMSSSSCHRRRAHQLLLLWRPRDGVSGALPGLSLTCSLCRRKSLPSAETSSLRSLSSAAPSWLRWTRASAVFPPPIAPRPSLYVSLSLSLSPPSPFPPFFFFCLA